MRPVFVLLGIAGIASYAIAVHLLSSSLDVFRNAFTRHNHFRLQTNEAALKIRFQPYRFPVFVSTVSRVSNFT